MKFLKPIRRSRAQTVAELAIFGAILIFILGLIVRYATNFNYTMNQQLKAMRLAMSWSYASSMQNQTTARNTASVLFIEDRLDVGATQEDLLKGSRVPYVVMGSGTMSRNLFMNLKWGNHNNISHMDMFINGQRFAFTVQGYKGYDIDPLVRNCGNDPLNPKGAYFPGVTTGGTRCQDIDPQCYWDNDTHQYRPCTILYTRILNTDEHWCGPNHADPPCGAGPGDVRQNKRFDLDRNPSTQCTGIDCTDGADVPRDKRNTFYWQWMPVKATNKHIHFGSGGIVNLDVDGDLKEESVMETLNAIGVGDNPTRKKLEGKFADQIERMLWGKERYLIQLNVLDSQSGDLDFTHNSYDAKGKIGPNGLVASPVRPGLMEESDIYTQVGDSYLLNEAGKLYSNYPNKQYVRDTTKKDRVDMISRMIQLSNDDLNSATTRFCYSNNTPVPGSGIEACATSTETCFQGGRLTRTCFDRYRPGNGHPVIYVRSRLEERRGRRWVTDISSDVNPIK